MGCVSVACDVCDEYWVCVEMVCAMCVLHISFIVCECVWYVKNDVFMMLCVV